MGPPRDRGGELLAEHGLVPLGEASMGPPRDRGGEGECMFDAADCPLQLQWGRLVIEAERDPAGTGGQGWTGFNGAAS